MPGTATAKSDGVTPLLLVASAALSSKKAGQRREVTERRDVGGVLHGGNLAPGSAGRRPAGQRRLVLLERGRAPAQDHLVVVTAPMWLGNLLCRRPACARRRPPRGPSWLRTCSSLPVSYQRAPGEPSASRRPASSTISCCRSRSRILRSAGSRRWPAWCRGIPDADLRQRRRPAPRKLVAVPHRHVVPMLREHSGQEGAAPSPPARPR